MKLSLLSRKCRQASLLMKFPASLCVALFTAFAVTGCGSDNAAGTESQISENCSVELVVLGVGQDAAAPQIGNHTDPAWGDGAISALLATSLGLVDHRNGARYLFEATPNISHQLKRLDDIAAQKRPPTELSAIFITHAHIGHYTGLMFLGREAAGANNVPVYAMPRLKDFLMTNGPWEQLVTLNNIVLNPLENAQTVAFEGGISVTPYQLPHRDEYSETVAYVISGEEKSALFVPDIDSWDEWEMEFGHRIEDMIASVDYAFLDATFYSDNELPGRDMSKIPHPRVLDMMTRFEGLAPQEKSKVNFIHINHTNPIRYVTSPETQDVIGRGFNVARRGDRHCL